MRIFVSSLMRSETDLLLRKSTVDAIHIVEHRPLYIETEEYRTDDHALKNMMIRMIGEADCFVGIYHSGDKGTPSAVLDDKTPIEYELHKFCDWNRGQDSPLLLFCRVGCPKDWINEVLATYDRLNSAEFIEFESYDDLIGVVHDRVEQFPADNDTRSSGVSIDLAYHGHDQAGLLQVVSEYLFTEHGMNIENVWALARHESALLYLSASSSGNDRSPIPSTEVLERRLLAQLKERFPDHADLFQETEYRGPLNAQTNNPEQQDSAFGYIDLRTIDAPGQLNTICKAIKDLGLNITRIHLAPAPLEFRRQTIISLEIKLDARTPTGTHDPSRMTRRAKYLRLESRLRDLVGVRAFTSRLAHPDFGHATTRVV